MPGEQAQPEEYSCSGTPADCVKLALRELLDRKPDLCVSGINHGSNASINVIYSGTMSAAIEAGIEGIPAIGFSLCDYGWEADFGPAEAAVKKIVGESLKKRNFRRGHSQREHPESVGRRAQRHQDLPTGLAPTGGRNSISG